MKKRKFIRLGILKCYMVKTKKRKMKRTGNFHVYILECRDGTYYTGHTNDLKRRLNQHNTGKGGARYTKWKKAGTLAWSKEYKFFKSAFRMERRIKKLTRLEKKALVDGKRIDVVFRKAGK